MIKKFEAWLEKNEKEKSTIRQYSSEAARFLKFCGGRVTKEAAVEYKEQLKSRYKDASVNAKLAAVNTYLSFLGKSEYRVKAVKVQKNVYSADERFLTREEYSRLIEAAESNERLWLLMQTICATGIRVSELRFVTAEAAREGFARVMLKGKVRVIFIPKKLCKMLLKYANRRKIKSGPIFVTRSGKPIDRSNIWREMKSLCQRAEVDVRKVFPHNLRHLFARTFYKAEKDIVRLADVLGHSSINTTRIYTMETGFEQRKRIERLGLIVGE